MTNPKPPAGFPETFGPDLTVSDIDLDTETFIVGGQRLTEQRAADLAEQAERRGGRPSLTGPGAHSPVLTLRVSQATKDELRALSVELGRRQSDLIREALDEYLTRHHQAS